MALGNCSASCLTVVYVHLRTEKIPISSVVFFLTDGDFTQTILNMYSKYSSSLMIVLGLRGLALHRRLFVYVDLQISYWIPSRLCGHQCDTDVRATSPCGP